MFRTVCVWVTLGSLLAMDAWAGDAEESPWPVLVSGWEKPAPGEHPRLLFRRSDLAELKRRAATPEGKQIIERLRSLLGGGESMPPVKNPMTSAYGKEGGSKPGKSELPEGTYSISHAAGFGLLYQLTGERRYADLGRQCFEWAFEGGRDRDREARYSWRKPGGALRAGPSLGWYALGYDLCYDGWDEAFRLKVARAIAEYDEGKFMSLSELARGARHMPASNHWGMQVGGAALALLAIRGDPGMDAEKVERLLEVNSKAMIRNVTEGFGDHGWFPEGDGTGVMASFISYVPALQAWHVAGGRDFVSSRPNAQWLILRWIMLTVNRDGKPQFPSRGAYPHNVWCRHGMSGPGVFCEGFGVLPERYHPALLWMYNRTRGTAEEEPLTLFDTSGGYPHRAVLALVNWPFGMEEGNPGDVLPHAVLDRKHGFAMFRNRWRDENDIVVTALLKSTRGWHRTTGGDIMVWGLGQRRKFPVRVTGTVKAFDANDDGGQWTTSAGSFAVDFSGLSGADALLALSGSFSGRVSGKDIQILSVGDSSLVLMTVQSEPAPAARVVDDHVEIGQRVIRVEGTRIVYSEMETP